MTFSCNKNHSTFKVLLGVSSAGVISFVSNLYSGSIFDKELTRQSGVLDLPEKGDSVMADRGCDIQDNVATPGVKLKVPSFLRGKVN